MSIYLIGQEQVIHILIDNGADINVTDKHGNAPIYYAAKKSIISINMELNYSYLVNIDFFFEISDHKNIVALLSRHIRAQ